MAKRIVLTFRNSSLDIVLTGFRHKFPRGKRKLPLIGTKRGKKYVFSFYERKRTDYHYRMIWFPFVMLFRTWDGSVKYFIRQKDPLTLKCYLEYEHWLDLHGKLDLAPFVAHVSSKYGVSADSVVESCREVSVVLNKGGSSNDGVSEHVG